VLYKRYERLFFLIACFANLAMGSSLFREEKTELAGVNVTIYEPSSPPSGITFFLTGANTSLVEYKSTIEVLLEQKQLVVGYYINVFWPPTKNNHEIKACRVTAMFDAIGDRYPFELRNEYNIVGHSVGGKIGLLVSTRFDKTRVKTMIALDPVDQNPPVFTLQGGVSDKLDGTAKIVLTLTDGGNGISEKHNAEAIHKENPLATTLVRHKDAGHMAYTDNGGGLFGLLMKGGTNEGNAAARKGGQDIIRMLIPGPHQTPKNIMR